MCIKLLKWSYASQTKIELNSTLYSTGCKIGGRGTHWSYCALFLWYGNLLAENCEFFLAHSHLIPLLKDEPFRISRWIFYRQCHTRVLGLFVGEDFVILACIVLTQSQHVTDRQKMKGQLDHNIGVCIVTYTDAL